eukprot:96482_1
MSQSKTSEVVIPESVYINYFLKQQAKLLWKQAKWAEVREILERILKIEASNDKLLYKMAQVNEKLNNFVVAKKYYQNAIKINPKNVNTLQKLALLHHYQFADLSHAEKYYVQCTHINPNNDYIHFNLAKLYTEQKQYKKACKSFEKCDYSKAAVNYHFGMYALAINKPKTAMKHFKLAIKIKPEIANYHFEYAKLCTKNLIFEYSIKANKSFNKSFNKAIKLSNYRNSKFCCEYALFCKYKYNSDECATKYINLALRLKPNNIFYRYIHLKFQPQKRVSLCLKYSITNVIQDKAELLLCGYVYTRQLKRFVNVDVLSVIRNYFIGDYPFISKTTNNYPLYVVSMLFDVLCPGKDESKIIFVITELIDLISTHSSLMETCLMVLIAISKLTNIYDILSMIDGIKHYVNYKEKIIFHHCYHSHFYNHILFQLFRANHAFYQIYSSHVQRRDKRSILYICRDICLLTPSNLKYIRLMIVRFFGIGHMHNINGNTSTLKILSQYLLNRNKNIEVIPMVSLIELEMICLHKNDLHYELEIALDNILYFMWNCVQSFSDRMKCRFVTVLQIFTKINLCLKPYEMHWNVLFVKLSYLKGKHKSEIGKIFKLYRKLNGIYVNDENYENWQHCIDLLVH